MFYGLSCMLTRACFQKLPLYLTKKRLTTGQPETEEDRTIQIQMQSLNCHMCFSFSKRSFWPAIDERSTHTSTAGKNEPSTRTLFPVCSMLQIISSCYVFTCETCFFFLFMVKWEGSKKSRNLLIKHCTFIYVQTSVTFKLLLATVIRNLLAQW